MEIAAPQGVHLTQIAAGANHATAVGDDGKSYSWGSNIEGYLGDGTSTDSVIPVAVVLPLAFAPSGVPEVLSADVDGTAVAVGWTGIEADGYRVRLHPSSGDDVIREVGPDETSVVVSSLIPGSTYEVSVAGTSWVGAGRYSVPVSATIPAVATSVSVAAKTVTYGQKGSLDVRVAPASATGTVGVRVGAATYRAPVVAGQARIVLPARAQGVGRQSVDVAFTPSESQHAASAGRATYQVVKATPTLKVTTNKSRVKRGAGLRVAVRVSAPGLAPTGRVKVVVAGKSRTVAIKNGKATAVFTSLRRTGTGKKIVVRYLGSSTVKAGTGPQPQHLDQEVAAGPVTCGTVRAVPQVTVG
ncbi:fibronectin type III domain-containing protein [Aeromicrobium sp. UC242_57]|uniref:fibronectin type III domain-containing protein n=1 Tax=Aeromicrobium sp. UC242_57 TaxID=3374624 RepID=UPI0037AC3B8B